MPASDTLAGLFGSLLAICNAAVLGPCSCGAKLTPSVHLAPEGIWPKHPLELIKKSCGSAPANVKLEICSGPVPELVIVSDCGLEMVCSGWVPGKLNPPNGLTCAVALSGVIVTDGAFVLVVGLVAALADGAT